MGNCPHCKERKLYACTFTVFLTPCYYKNWGQNKNKQGIEICSNGRTQATTNSEIKTNEKQHMSK